MENEQLFSLIQKYIQGDNYAFTIFFNETKSNVFANIYSYVKNQHIAEDILSDVYVKFIANIKKIRSNQSILGYLYVISKNLSLNYLNRHPKAESINDYPFLTDKQDDIQSTLDYQDIIQVMKKVLSNEMFSVIVMRLINELSYKEISKITKKKESTIRWLYSEGIKKVKEELYAKQYRETNY